MNIKNKISELIGNTPMVFLQQQQNEYARIAVKLEYFNPGGSVKDRLAMALIRYGEKTRLINKQTTIIEPTSGNTGIGLAMICAEKKYSLILTMPESASIERRKVMKALGAELILTSTNEGMKGAIKEAERLHESIQNSYIPFQFSNPSNPEIHQKTTAIEIWDDTQGNIDVFVAGIGTGGTFTGISKVLKEKNANIKTYAAEPQKSPVISGGLPGKHKIQGIGAGFIPDILDTSLIDDVIQIPDEEAIETAANLALTEGIFCGFSGGGNVWAARKLAQQPANKDKLIVTIIPDSGERYLSMID